MTFTKCPCVVEWKREKHDIALLFLIYGSEGVAHRGSPFDKLRVTRGFGTEAARSTWAWRWPQR